MDNNIILNKQQIAFIAKRIAFQVLENYDENQELIIAGIKNSGYIFAEKIAKELESISNMKVTLCAIKVNKQKPWEDIEMSLAETEYTNKSVLLVDDVMNSGATLIYALRKFLNVPLQKIKTAVLVDRNHKKFPIKADFKGISLSTSILEHIQVHFGDDDEYAFLN